jgi:hypothetical protein
MNTQRNIKREYVAAMTPPLEEVLTALTPLQWFQIITRDTEGPVPPGCGNGELAADLLGFLQGPYPHRAAVLAQQLTDEDIAGSFPSLGPFTEALVGWLEEHRPGWRTEQETSPEDMTRFDAHLRLVGRVGGDAPYRRETDTREEWDRPYRIALIRLGYPLPRAEPYPTGWLDDVHGALRDALLAGAPPAALIGLHDAARGLYVAHVAAHAPEVVADHG